MGPCRGVCQTSRAAGHVCVYIYRYVGQKKVTFALLTQEIMSVEGVRILAPVLGEHAQILTPEAIKFLTCLLYTSDAADE